MLPLLGPWISSLAGQLRHCKMQGVVNKKRERERENKGFPYGSVVKKPPTSAGDMGSIPDLGRSHMWWSN